MGLLNFSDLVKKYAGVLDQILLLCSLGSVAYWLVYMVVTAARSRIGQCEIGFSIGLLPIPSVVKITFLSPPFRIVLCITAGEWPHMIIVVS